MKWKELTGNWFIFEAEFSMNATFAVRFEEDTGSIGPLAKVTNPTELNGNRLTKSGLPTLHGQEAQVLIPELNGEIPAAVAAAVAGVALYREVEREDGKANVGQLGDPC